MDWVDTPKTNWMKTDSIDVVPKDGQTVSDWDRITGNLQVLYEAAKPVAGMWPMEDTPERTTEDYWFPEVLNSVEANTDELAARIWPTFDRPERRYLVANEGFWVADDLNRIEGLALEIEPMIDKSVAARPTLSFLMGVDVIGSFV